MIIRRFSLIPLLLFPCVTALGQIPGAAADAIAVDDANMTAGQYTLTTTASTPFRCPGDVGKAIAVYGAGAQYPVWKNILGQRLPLALVTTIASCQKNNAVTLNAPAAFSVANVAMVFGTDDHAAVQACVTAAANGGHCTFPAGQSFMISNAGPNITVPSGATIDGTGTIYFAPQGTITAMTNDTLFGVNEIFGTNISYPFHIAAPIRPGQTYFSAYNNSDIAASGAAVNRYVLVEDADTTFKNASFVDWMQIKSIVPNDAMVAGTYISGITATGAAGQTCLLAHFNGSPTATATVALTGTNTIATGTPLFITDAGTGAKAPSNGARVGSLTATCTGTAYVKTQLGTTINTTTPFRMAFPGTNPWCTTGGPNQCSGLGWRTVLTPAHGIVIRDINIVVPPVASATRATRVFDIKGARGTLIENTAILQGGVLQDLEEEFNQGTNVIGNQWLSETGGINLAESVDGVYQGNTFDHQPTAWNGWQSPCSATITGGHVSMELGLGWFKFIQNSLPHPCYVGLTAFYGAHDGEIGANTIGRVSGYATFSTKNVGIAGIGLKNTLIHDNTLAGADGAASIGLGLGDFSTGLPPIDSNGNLIWGNVITGFAAGAYSFAGVLGTDCYYAAATGASASGSPCPKVIPFMMSPTPGTTLSSTSPTFSWSSGPGVSFYELCLGTALGKCDLYQKVSPTALSMTPTGLPNNGSTIYARLYYKIGGGWWYDSYTYVAP
jgi:hypothetical protein